VTPAALLAIPPLVLVATTIWMSIRATGNPINGYIIANLLRIVTVYLIPAIAPLLIDIELPVSPVAWTFAIIAQCAEIFGYLRGLRSAPPIQTDLVPIPKERLRAVAIVSLVLAAVIYSPIILSVGIVPAFTNPRAEIYEVTRTGYGHIYFVAGSFLTLFCLLGIYSFRHKWLVILIGAAASLPFGNKTRFLILANTVLIYFVFFHPVQKYLRRPIAVAITGVLLLALIPAAFWYTTYDVELGELHKMVLGFGFEYQSNFSLLVKEFSSHFPAGFFHGRIFLEDNLLAFAPRVLWPGKPLYFGSLLLSDTIFPILTEMDKGAPSFGPFAQAYADFGPFGALQLVTQYSLMGYLLGRFEANVRQNDVRSFLCLFTLTSGGFVAVGGPINPAISALVNLLVISILIKVLRHESHPQPAPMSS